MTNLHSNMKPLAEYQKQRVADKIKENLSLGWVFDKWYEKVILAIISYLAAWKLLGFF